MRIIWICRTGLGKTFVGSAKLCDLGKRVNLLVCQKSKISDWVEHFKTYHANVNVFDITKQKELIEFVSRCQYGFDDTPLLAVINYDLVFRRTELKFIDLGTLMLDESSMIQNESAKRSKFLLQLHPECVILLSGTPTSGKYERLYSQLRLLGWGISKRLYWNQYIVSEGRDNLPVPIVKGYKNVDRLKSKLREHGAVFMKSDEILDLPKQNFIDIKVPKTKDYRKFHKDKIVNVDGNELVGTTSLTELLYKRQLCGAYNKAKLDAFEDLVQSTDDRLIVFYNFNDELVRLQEVIFEAEKPFSVVNGALHDLYEYEHRDNSVTFIQYQAGAMGLNLQKANKIIYYTPPLSSELFEQSKKRVHRIGQDRPCYYYKLLAEKTIEENIYSVLNMRKDFTDELFREQNRL